MSPLNISILLHYYTTPGDYRAKVDWAHANSPAVRESLEWFVENGLLLNRYGDISFCVSVDPAGRDTGETQVFKITEKGEAMVKHLCQVEVPVCVWMQPAAITQG